MTYNEYTELSNADSRVLVDFSFTKVDAQWVNVGAGLWLSDFDNTYSSPVSIDSSLIPGAWDTIDVGDIGSVQVNYVTYVQVTNLSDLTATEASWYWDRTNGELYLHTLHAINPMTALVEYGELYGYADTSFTPADSPIFYDGRLVSIPTFGVSRDPLFFGRLSFPSFTVQLANGDGHFDSWASDNDIYGNVCRVRHGYADLDYDEYALMYSGVIESVEIGEEAISVAIVDRRATLKRKVAYSCTAKNALEAIRELLLDNYGYTFTSVFFDTTQWVASESAAPSVTVDEDDEEVINIIEGICVSVFGFFSLTRDGRFTFRFIDTSAAVSDSIPMTDILNRNKITYSPAEVISSVEIQYAETASGYSIYTDTSREADIFEQYKVYNQQSFTTYLPTATAASVLATSILDYVDEVHGAMEIISPLRYYELSVGDTANVEVNRPAATMLGTVKSEIISVSYDLEAPNMTIGVRFV